MGLITSIFKAREPTNSTSGSAYSFFLGGSSSGKRVNERTSMQMTAVYSCVRILAEAIAGLPVHVYRYNEDGSKETFTEEQFGLADMDNSETVTSMDAALLRNYLIKNI